MDFAEMTKPISFIPFHAKSPVTIYRRHLPHWRQDGATYFVTFRLVDSIPAAVIAMWEEQREIWYRAHQLTDELTEAEWRKRYAAIPEAERIQFERRETRQLFAKLDECHGACWLKQKECAESVANALTYFDNLATSEEVAVGTGTHGGPHRLRCGDFVIMPNHVHWLVKPEPGFKLEDLLRSIKQFSANQINRVVGRSGSVWQKESYDHLVRDRAELNRIRTYIADNPGKAGLSNEACRLYAADWN
jgi:type I restriction enzyme R subunit